LKERFARNSARFHGLIHIGRKLGFTKLVHSFEFLLFQQLLAEFGYFFAERGFTVLTRRLFACFLFDGAFARVTAVPFQKQFLTSAAAIAAF
jgi:hypothetical protein